MKAHTQTFKENLIKLGKEIDAKITYTIDGVTTELGGDELSSVTPHYEGAILKSVMKQVDIVSDVDIPVGTEINVQFGMKYGDDPYEYIDYGNYIVFSSDKQEDTNDYRLVCYDKMLYSMKEYEPLNVTYPITVRNYLIALCNKLGLTFADSSNTFANYNQNITSDPYADQGYTYRDVLDELAQVTASTLCINTNDELEVRYITSGESDIEPIELPDGYTQIKYVETNGTQYISTNYRITNNINYEITFEPLEFGTEQYIIGSSYSSFYNEVGWNQNGKLKISYLNSQTLHNQLNLNQKYTILKNGRYFYLDDTLIKTGGSGNFTGSRLVPIIAHRTSSVSDNAIARIYRVKLYNGTTLLMNLVPCIQNSTNKAGMFNLVNNSFVQSASGTFVAGEIVNAIEEINEDYIKNTRASFGEKYGPVNSIVLSRSAESDNVYLQDEDSVEQNGLCEIKIKDNQIMNDNTRDRFLPDILEKLDGLEYYLNDFESIGITYLDLCDKYNVKIGENVYPCIMFNDEVEIEDGLNEIIYTKAPEETVTDYTKADKTDRRINQTYLIVDKQNQRIDAVVSTQEDFSDSLSSLSVTVDGIQSKVELNYDFVRETSGNNYVSVDDIQQEGLIKLEITGTAISNGYLRLHITNNNPEYVDLPITTILKQNDSLYDILSIEAVYNEDTELYELHCFIDKKLDYIENQVVARSSANNFLLNQNSAKLTTQAEVDLILENYVEGKQDLGIINIPIQEGQHTFSIDSYNNLNYYLKYAVLNNITSEFALKKHIVSEINQSAEEIQINADKISMRGKTIEMTSDNININSDNFKVDNEGNMVCNNAQVNGTINSNNGNIAGWEMTTEGLTNGAVKIMNNGGTTIYTIADVIILRGHLNGTAGFEIPDILKSRYDLNNDGQLTLADLVLLQNLLKINIE